MILIIVSFFKTPSRSAAGTRTLVLAQEGVWSRVPVECKRRGKSLAFFYFLLFTRRGWRS